MVDRTTKIDKIINLLHLARKAGCVVFGFEACKRSCLQGFSKLVIIASDLAEKKKAEMIEIARSGNVKWAEIGTMALYGEAFKSRNLGIICLENVNFAKGIIKWLG